MNGQTVNTPGSSWTFDANASELVLKTTFRVSSHPIEAGSNVLEVSVVDGNGTSQRLAVVFVMNPDDAYITGPLSVRSDQSQFDAPRDDHGNTDQEYVILEWAGDSPLPLRGWRLQDMSNKHRYYFPDVEVPPHSTIRIVTGGHPDQDTATEVHMGQTQAVWNNRGDAVHVIDDREVLRAFFPYGSTARELRR